MKIKRLRKHGFLESCASSDLAFLLIIYFLIVAGFNINKGFLINLPSLDSTQLVLSEDLLRFNMDAGGNVFHKGEILSLQNTKSIIQTAQFVNPNIAVIVSIDGRTRWQNVVSFVELAQDLEVESFSFSIMDNGAENP